MNPARVADIVESCDTCGSPVHAGSTTCECGERLTPHTVDRTDVRSNVRLGPPGCTCHGNGICTACVIDEYDNGRWS